MSSAERVGTEVSFRLDPGGAESALEIARRLAAAAGGALRHVTFVGDEAGEYGCLAEWDDAAAAAAYAGRPEVREVLDELAVLTGRPARVRVYRMVEQTPGPAG